MKEKKGITLISLSVIIIVILILTGIAINSIVGDNGLLNKTIETSFKSDVSEIIDVWEKTLIDRIREGGDESLIEIFEDEEKRNALNNMDSNMISKLEIQNGKLVYIDSECTDEERQWFEDMGIYTGYIIDAVVTTVLKTKSEKIKVTEKQGYDLVLVLDISGSMNYSTTSGKTRIEETIPVINQVMDDAMKNSLNRIGVILFSSSAVEFLPLDHYTNISISSGSDSKYFNLNKSGSSVYLNISTGVKNSKEVSVSKKQQVDGGTYTQAGIQKGAEMLINGVASSQSGEFKNNTPGIILVTDGMPYYSTSYTNPCSTNYASTTATIDGGFYTVLSAKYFKDKIKTEYSKYNNKEPMFFTIGVGMSETADNNQYQRLLLNPNKQNMEKSKLNNTGTLDSTNRYSDITAQKLYEKLISSSNPYASLSTETETGYSYADASSISSFDSTQLQEVFEKYIETLGSRYEIETESQGMYETVTIVEIEDKEKINVEIDESEKIKVSVTASVVKNIREDENGKIIYEVDPNTVVTKKKENYTLDEIKNGIDPNFKYSDGKIIWYLRKEYIYSKGLAAEALAEVTAKYENSINKATESIQITKIEVEYYIKEKTE